MIDVDVLKRKIECHPGRIRLEIPLSDTTDCYVSLGVMKNCNENSNENKCN